MAEVLASSFLGKIGDILLEKIGYFVVAPIGRQFTYVCCFNSNIKELETQVEELQRTRQGVRQSVEEDKRNVRDIDANVKAWLEKADKVLEKANKVLTEVKRIIQEYPEVEETNSLLAEGRQCTSTLPQIPQEPRAPGLPFFNPGVNQGCFNGWCRNLKLRYSLSRKVVKKTKDILELKVDGIEYTKLSHSPTPACLETILNRDFEDFESRKDQMEEVMEALKQDKINLIGISGLPGVGKTKMVKEVGRRAKEEELFDEVGFVPVGQDLDLTNVQNCIAESFGLLDLKNYDHAITRANLLRKRLSQDKKRILLILDDIWEKFDLEEQGIPLESASGTFKFLYTSRKGGLWDEVCTKEEIALELLSEEEAWQLFRDKAGDLADAPKLESTAKEIVKKCGSLPLALVIIGGLLSDKRRESSIIDRWEDKRSETSIIDRWEEMLDRLTYIMTNPADDMLFSSLKLSYDYLKEEARELFLLCCLFEEDKSVCVEDLVKYALGLSLFVELDGMSKVRRKVATLVGELKSRNLLLEGDYGHKSVKVHDVVRDMGRHIASKYEGALVSHGVASDWPKKDTYENYTTISMISEKITELPEGLKCRDLKFLLLQCRKLKKLPCNFFEGMDKLKVLELRDFHGILGLQYLRNLTMLSLEGFGGKLDNIVVITDLENLEILSFRGSWIKELPEEVGKLLKLRLLDLITKARMSIPPNVISCLKCLEELYIGDNYVDPREFGSSRLPKLQIIQIDESIGSVPSVLAKAQDDAVNLNRAFAGWGCDEATIVKILAHRSAIWRALIRQEYKIKFSEDFDNRLSKELLLKRDLKRALLLWMDEPANRDAKLVKHGLSKNAAIEVICSRTPSQLEELKKAYRTLFGVYLDKDIESHAHGKDSKKLLVAFAGTIRSESPEVDAVMVDKDAKDLFKEGEWRLGTNEETFIRIFSERSGAHLAAISSAYREMYENSLKKAVKKETSSKFKYALLTILQCAENPGKYFAKALHKAMDGVGTDDETLTRIIVSRAEVDIEKIKAEYLKKYGKKLSDDVHSDTSEQYRAFLLSLLNPNA